MALLRPFIPARDFTLSRRFYEAVGFRVDHAGDDLVIFDQDGAGFLLQKFYERSLAENLMLQLFVADVDAWWERTGDLAERFGVRAPIAPVDKPEWGLRVGFLFDPSGVLWHVAQELAQELGR